MFEEDKRRRVCRSQRKADADLTLLSLSRHCDVGQADVKSKPDVKAFPDLTDALDPLGQRLSVFVKVKCGRCAVNELSVM